MAGPKGSWEGSDVTEEEIKWLRRTRKQPPASEVAARAPGREVVPAPQDDEHVIFAAHLARGFGLPASLFFRRFLTFFGLQPHHLGANSILQLAAFVAFCEGYLGLWPSTEIWSRMFYLRPMTLTNKEMTACGAALVYVRPAGGFPKLPLVESAKKWQRTFFYVKNVEPANDRINLPPFVNAPPAAKQNWGHDPKKSSAEINNICSRLENMMKYEGLVKTDFIAAFISRRVLPLQRRPHRMCDMTLRKDPCRLSTFELTPAQVAHWVNRISTAKLDESTWFFGKEPYCRNIPAPARFPSQQTHDGPNPLLLAPDRLDSDDEDFEVDDTDSDGAGLMEEEEELENPEPSGAGGSGAAGDRPDAPCIQDWSDDDDDDVMEVTAASRAAAPAAPAGTGPVLRRRLRRQAEMQPHREPAASEPHMEQPASEPPLERRPSEARLLEKRPAAELPAGGRHAVKKVRLAGQAAEGRQPAARQPAGRAKRPIPTSSG